MFFLSFDKSDRPFKIFDAINLCFLTRGLVKEVFQIRIQGLVRNKGNSCKFTRFY